jgi:hypothetical protein
MKTLALLAVSIVTVASARAQTAPADPAAGLEAHGDLAPIASANAAAPCFGARELTTNGTYAAVSLMWSEHQDKRMEEMVRDVDYSDIRPWLCKADHLQLFARVSADGWALLDEKFAPGELDATNSMTGEGGVYVSPAILAKHAQARAAAAKAAAAARPAPQALQQLENDDHRID